MEACVLNFTFLNSSTIRGNEFQYLITSILVMNFLIQTAIIKLAFERDNSFCVRNHMSCFYLNIVICKCNIYWEVVAFHQNTQQMRPSMKTRFELFLQLKCFLQKMGKTLFRFKSQDLIIIIHSIKKENHIEFFNCKKKDYKNF